MSPYRFAALAVRSRSDARPRDCRCPRRLPLPRRMLDKLDRGSGRWIEGVLS
jgi:hypothetical protein